MILWGHSFYKWHWVVHGYTANKWLNSHSNSQLKTPNTVLFNCTLYHHFARICKHRFTCSISYRAAISSVCVCVAGGGWVSQGDLYSLGLLSGNKWLVLEENLIQFLISRTQSHIHTVHLCEGYPRLSSEQCSSSSAVSVFPHRWQHSNFPLQPFCFFT